MTSELKLAECQLCRRVFKVVTHTHLSASHNISVLEYKAQFPDALIVWNAGQTKETNIRIAEAACKQSAKRKGIPTHRISFSGPHSETTKNKIGNASREHWKDLEYRKRQIAKSTGKHWKWSSESKGHKGWKQSATAVEANRLRALKRWQDPIFVAKQQAARQTPAYLEKRKVVNQRNSERMKALWADSEQAQRFCEAQNRRPTNLELLVQSVLDEIQPNEWEYVGDGKVWIAGKNPDFINRTRKLVLEANGTYWHQHDEPGIRSSHFRKYGWGCLEVSGHGKITSFEISQQFNGQVESMTKE